MKILKIFLLLIFALPEIVLSEQLIPGCQGEGCDCIDGLRNGGELGKTEIETKRPFKLYMKRSLTSKILGNFPGKIKATPMHYDMVIIEKGEHKVIAVKNNKIKLKPGDTLDTLFYVGEGVSKAKHDGEWISFKSRYVQLEKVKETKFEEWLQVRMKINGTVGFTQDSPFENCHE